MFPSTAVWNVSVFLEKNQSLMLMVGCGPISFGGWWWLGPGRLSGSDPALTYKLSAGPVPPNHASQATAHALLPHDPPTFSLSI